MSCSQITLPCVVQNKKGLLQWTKDGFGLGVARDLPGYPRYTMTGEEARGNWSLEISPVRSSDDGVYQCQVSSQGQDPAIRSRQFQHQHDDDDDDDDDDDNDNDDEDDDDVNDDDYDNGDDDNI